MITAFKIARSEGNSAIVTAPIRMSFQIEDPFYPYREPIEPRTLPRILRVLFVGPAPVEALLKGSMRPWGGKVLHRARVSDDQRAALASDLGVDAKGLPARLVLTAFEDRTVVRPQADVVFARRIGPPGSVRVWWRHDAE